MVTMDADAVGVVLAGGTGSRLAPLTKTVNKHLLPVNGRPMLHWPLRTLARLGIRRAVVVLGGRSCGEVIEHFGTRYATDGDAPDGGVISLSYVHQDTPDGIAGALARAGWLLRGLGASRAVVILGDNVFPGEPPRLLESGAADRRAEMAQVVAYHTDDFASYGCVRVSGGVYDVAQIVEKPQDLPQGGGSWAALLGLYVFPIPDVLDVTRRLLPSKRGELEVTDLISHFARGQRLRIVRHVGRWIDAGDPAGYALSNDHTFWNE